jgi:hypothetical protein
LTRCFINDIFKSCLYDVISAVFLSQCSNRNPAPSPNPQLSLLPRHCSKYWTTLAPLFEIAPLVQVLSSSSPHSATKSALQAADSSAQDLTTSRVDTVNRPSAFSSNSNCISPCLDRSAESASIVGKNWRNNGLRLCLGVSVFGRGRQAMLIVPQTPQIYHPTGNCLDTPLPSTPQSHRLVQTWLPDNNRRRSYPTVGLLSHPEQYLDIPTGCDYWPDSVLHTGRRSVLLRNTDLQYDSAISDLEQTDFSSELYQFRQTSEELATPMECRTGDLGGVCYIGSGLDLERE